MNTETLPTLTVTRIEAIAAYGNRKAFTDIEETIEWVKLIKLKSGNPDLPLNKVAVKVIFNDGSYESCKYEDPARTEQWLSRFQP